MSVPEAAVEAAWVTVADYFDDTEQESWKDILRTALEAAAPHMLADHLLTLAADVRARGDIGKDDGLESWDYLTWQAERVRPTP